MNPERVPGEIDLDDVVGDDPRAEVARLLPHQLHQLGPAHSVVRVGRHQRPHGTRQRIVEIGLHVAGRKTRIVFHLGRQIQLTQGQRPRHAVGFGDGPFEDQGASSARGA